MSCNCKNNQSFSETNKTLETNDKNRRLKLTLTYSAKILGFLFLIAMLPLINIMIVWFMFNTIVLNKEANVGQIVKSFVGKKHFNTDEDDDDEDDDFEDLTEDDVEMLDVEDITDRSK